MSYQHLHIIFFHDKAIVNDCDFISKIETIFINYGFIIEENNEIKLKDYFEKQSRCKIYIYIF